MADSNGLLDYNDRIQRASWAITRAIYAEHRRMDARPPYVEFRNDVIERYVRRNTEWLITGAHAVES